MSQDNLIKAQHAADEVTASACSFVLLLQVDQRYQDDEKALGDGTTPELGMSR